MALSRCVVTLMLASLFAHAVQAQDGRLSPDLYKVSGQLSSSQQQQLDQYVKYWAGILGSCEADRVPAARQALTAPLAAGGTSFFNAAYSAAVCRDLIPVIGKTCVISRLNAMLVAAAQVEPSVLAVIERGLTDANPAVRYWAAKAATGGGERGLVTTLVPEGTTGEEARRAELEQRLLTALADAADKEKEPWVMQQMLAALVRLELPAAVDRVLGILDTRFQQLAAGPIQNVAGETFGLDRVARRIVVLRPYGSVDTQDMRQLALVSYKLGTLAAVRLAGELLGEEQALTQGERDAYQALLIASDRWLRWSLPQLGIKEDRLPAAVTTVERANLPGLVERYLSDDARGWKAALKDAGVKAEEVSVKISTARRAETEN